MYIVIIVMSDLKLPVVFYPIINKIYQFINLRQCRPSGAWGIPSWLPRQGVDWFIRGKD